MKSMLIKQMREEFGITKIEGKKLEMYSFYTLCGFCKRMRNGETFK